MILDLYLHLAAQNVEERDECRKDFE